MAELTKYNRLTKADLELYDTWVFFGKPPLRERFEDMPVSLVKRLKYVSAAKSLIDSILEDREKAEREMNRAMKQASSSAAPMLWSKPVNLSGSAY